MYLERIGDNLPQRKDSGSLVFDLSASATMLSIEILLDIKSTKFSSREKVLKIFNVEMTSTRK